MFITTGKTAMNEIGFPGLGLDPILIDSTAFTVLGREVKWYGIIICLGMILAYCYALSRAKYEGIKTDDLIDLALALMIFGIAGARLYYVIFEIDRFVATGGTFFSNLWNTIVNIFSIHSGGLAIFGGIIAGFFTAMVVARIKKIRFPILLDVLAPSVMIGQMIGRWGNFMNGEAYGVETTLPWRMSITQVLSSGFKSTTIEVHPTFLYESLWNLVGFIVIAILYKKKNFHGQWLCFYLAWYGLGRMLIEGLRTDSLMIGPFRVSQLLAAAICVAGVVLLVLGTVKAKKEAK
ncbi:MAG: prolipoprotein diacylglyceryl transferase [Clostridia bacterium]|nr:prolipoprotein diacylglyceryl transferase [Clostridia bacterium]